MGLTAAFQATSSERRLARNVDDDGEAGCRGGRRSCSDLRRDPQAHIKKGYRDAHVGGVQWRLPQ